MGFRRFIQATNDVDFRLGHSRQRQPRDRLDGQPSPFSRALEERERVYDRQSETSNLTMILHRTTSIFIKYTVQTHSSSSSSSSRRLILFGAACDVRMRWLGVDSRHCGRGVVPMIFRSTITAETRHDSTGALSSLPATRPSLLPLSPVSFRSVSLPPDRSILFSPPRDVPPPPIFYPSLIRTRSFLPSASLSSSFAHAVFLLPLCFILFTRERSVSLSLSHCELSFSHFIGFRSVLSPHMCLFLSAIHLAL